METPTKSRHNAARRHKAGVTGARARWGPPRIFHVGDLSPDQRRLVLAFVEMARAADAKGKAEAEVEPASAQSSGGTRHAAPTV